jgi:hypothetical protein
MKKLIAFSLMIIFLATNVYAAKKEQTNILPVTPPGLNKNDKIPPGLAKKDKVPPGWSKGKKNHGNADKVTEIPTVGNLVDKALSNK